MMPLFAFFGIWQTALFAGAAAVAVPVIIHLLNRRRYKVVTWAAMRFLLNAQKQNTRRMRVEQLLLLLVRMALVALIVFAMASVMPWAENLWASVLPEGLIGSAPRRSQRAHHVIVLDGSLSMNAAVEGKPAFEHARQLALQKVADGQSGDGYSVLLLKENPSWIVPEASQDQRKVEREIQAARASHGNASLPAALSMVAAKLTEQSNRFPIQAVYFLTDVQKATWQAGMPAASADPKADDKSKERTALTEIQQRARVFFVDVGRDEMNNLAVTDLAFSDPFVTSGTEIFIQATVRNFGQQPKRNLRIELLVGKARETGNDPVLSPRVANQALLEVVPPGENVPVIFKHKFAGPGTYAVQARLDADDLDLDDSRTVIVTVKDTIPVLLVNGKPAADRYDRATEYLRLALNPFPPGSEPRYAPLRPRVINQAQFIDITDAELAGYDAIYWCDVGQFGTGDLRRVEAHLRRGGGFVVSMGDRAAENLDAYNRLLAKDEQSILPAQLLKRQTAPAEHHFFLDAPHEKEAYLDWPLRAFKDDPDRLALRNSRFRQYVQAKVASEGKVRTILSYMPEVDDVEKAAKDVTLPISDPALIEWNPPLGAKAPLGGRARGGQAPARYRGKVVLMTSTFNMDWTSWPGSPSFGAMMQELARLAVSGRLREQAASVGTVLEEFLPGGSAELDATIHYPVAANLKPNRSRTQLVEDVNVFRFTDTDLSGIYRVEFGGSGPEVPFAVNVPASTSDQRGSESDLSRLSEDLLRELFSGWDLKLVKSVRDLVLPSAPDAPDPTAGTLERVPVGPTFARYAIYVVLLLLFAEVVLAWKFGHYTTVEGVTAPAATGLLVPISVAATAAVLFGIGAYIMVDAVRNGDLFSFLPIEVRTLIEGFLGVPVAPAGESNRWEPDFMPWLPAFLGAIGTEHWWALAIALGGAALIFLTYLAEAPAVSKSYKLLLGALRLMLLVLTVWVLLPQFKIGFPRTGWPDLVILIDTSRSMGEPDAYQDQAVVDKAKKLSEVIRKQVQDTLPEKVRALEAALAAKKAEAEKDKDVDRDEIDYLSAKLQYWQKQQDVISSEKWRPTRLQLVQALLARPENDWLATLLQQRQMKLHFYQLDANGRALKLSDLDGPVGDLNDGDDPRQIQRTRRALAHLEAEGKDSRLGTALRQVIDHYRGSSLAGVVMLTDGVTTRDEAIAQVSEYAAQKGVPLFLVGIGDNHEVRDLKLHDLQVDDTVFKGDRVLFECRLTGQGYKDLTVPVVLKVKQKDGKEKEVDRTSVKVDPNGKSVKVRLKHQPMEIGRKLYIIEVEPPKVEGVEKPLPPGNLRLERYIEVIENRLIKVLYVEGMPRYEFRYVKFLLEREAPDAKKTKSFELKVVLLDADAEFASQDKSALADFPATLEELNQYDVVIMGDCDPNHAKLGKQRLQNLANFVRGEDEKGRKLPKSGGGLLMIAGPQFSPHAFKDTPLAEVLPIDPLTGKSPQEPANRDTRLRPELTPAGRMHPIFRFSQDEAENLSIWQRLAPIYWTSSSYKLKPLAEVLAIHPTEKAVGGGSPSNQDGRHPLAVQQFVGTGRSMFFGFDETWRWRLREDEQRFNHFWVQTMRYLSRGRSSRTDLRVDRQTPYRLGEPIKVTVRFPDNVAGPDGARVGPNTDVKVVVEYRPGTGKDTLGDPEFQTLQLAKVEGSWGTYEGLLSRTREGKYRFRLINPDVSKTQPDGEKPSADATVELPPGELDRLRMNLAELTAAADATHGKFYNLVTADQVLDDLPTGVRPVLSSPLPPLLIWNKWFIFSLVMLLLTSEWLLRKRKHLL